MTYNPEVHHRNSIGLQSYDYRAAGAYFITVCTFQKEPTLAVIAEGEVRLTPLGEIVQTCWDEIIQHFSHIELDHFVVMPNHLHGIIIFNDPASTVGAQHAAPLQNVMPGSLGAVVRSFKSACTKRINELRGTPGLQVWQRNYHERVVRDDVELHGMRDYIQNNPARWEGDSEHYLALRKEIKASP